MVVSLVGVVDRVAIGQHAHAHNFGRAVLAHARGAREERHAVEQLVALVALGGLRNEQRHGVAARWGSHRVRLAFANGGHELCLLCQYEPFRVPFLLHHGEGGEREKGVINNLGLRVFWAPVRRRGLVVVAALLCHTLERGWYRHIGIDPCIDVRRVCHARQCLLRKLQVGPQWNFDFHLVWNLDGGRRHIGGTRNGHLPRVFGRSQVHTGACTSRKANAGRASHTLTHTQKLVVFGTIWISLMKRFHTHHKRLMQIPVTPCRAAAATRALALFRLAPAVPRRTSCKRRAQRKWR